MSTLQTIIENAWEDRTLLKENTTQEAIREVIEKIDLGELRCAQPTDAGWQ